VNLSILCVTRADYFAWPFLRAMSTLANDLDAELVFGADGQDAYTELTRRSWSTSVQIFPVKSGGCLEGALDQVIPACTRANILRLDDDEKVTPALQEWLTQRLWTGVDLWKFPRLNLYGDSAHALKVSPLWPDHQTRLSSKAKAGGRVRIHDGSPFGGGELAPVALAHHKFLCKTLEERREISTNYERLQPGAGKDMLVFSVPEDVLTPAQLADTFTFGSGWIS
jgi:hypothetical protein